MRERSLILHDGGVGSLVATCVALSAGRVNGRSSPESLPGVLIVRGEGPEASARMASARAQAEQMGLEVVEFKPPRSRYAGVSESFLLVAAATVAAHRGYDRLVWPVHAAGVEQLSDADLDRIALVTDRALLATRLVFLDAHEHGRPGIRVDTPMADLTDRQVAELAIDTDAPVHLAWWWDAAAEAGRAEREAWDRAFAALGRAEVPGPGDQAWARAS